MKTIKWLVFGVLSGWSLFLVQDFFTHKNLKIIGNNDFVVLQEESGILFGWGKENPRFIKSLNFFVSQKNYFSLDSFEPGSVVKTKQVEIKTVTQNLVIGQWNQAKLLFFRSNFVPEKIKQSPLNFQADFWVLEKNSFPDFIPPPKEAILLLSPQKPSKKLLNFAQKHKTPLVSIYKTAGFVFELKKDSWNFLTQK